MKAVILYGAFLLVGVALSVGAGLVVEGETSFALGLIVFLSLFFSNFAIAWILTILVMDGSSRTPRAVKTSSMRNG